MDSKNVQMIKYFRCEILKNSKLVYQGLLRENIEARSIKQNRNKIKQCTKYKRN